jgi:hypothetical protein
MWPSLEIFRYISNWCLAVYTCMCWPYVMLKFVGSFSAFQTTYIFACFVFRVLWALDPFLNSLNKYRAFANHWVLQKQDRPLDPILKMSLYINISIKCHKNDIQVSLYIKINDRLFCAQKLAFKFCIFRIGNLKLNVLNRPA